jgi:hypothetical protein
VSEGALKVRVSYKAQMTKLHSRLDWQGWLFVVFFLKIADWVQGLLARKLILLHKNNKKIIKFA